MRRAALSVFVFYLACLILSFFGEPWLLGAIGRTPLALLDEPKSIDYMYSYFSYDNYNKKGKYFWTRRGAMAGIPKYQRLFGGWMLASNPKEALEYLKKSAEANDYYAAVVLSDLYADPTFEFKNQILAKKYQTMADQLEHTVPK